MSRASQPAFPTTAKELRQILDGGPPEPVDVHYCGLTIREHFAAMAMQGLAANGGFSSNEQIAIIAVGIADALIAELSK
jgi:hypothetical protein